MAPLGPQLPPGLQKRRRSEDDESESDSSTGPAPPPKPAHQQSPPASKRSRVIGPSLPPEPSNDPTPPTPPRPAAEEDSDSDDDDFGPSLPSASDGLQNTSISVSMGPQRPGPPDATAPLKRDEWMTLAPADGDWSSRVDPTKLKNRKFNTGRGAKAPPRAGTGGDNSSWHETPEQKQARLKREVMGVGDTSTTGKPSKQGREISAADEATARRLKEYKETQRGPSLYASHSASQKQSLDDDPSARAFDREKDIGSGSAITATQRRDMVKKASDFSSRFEKAKYL